MFSAHLFQCGDNLHQDFTNSLDVCTDAKDALYFIDQGQATHTGWGGVGCQHGNRGGREQYFRSENYPFPSFAKDKPKLMQLKKKKKKVFVQSLTNS